MLRAGRIHLEGEWGVVRGGRRSVRGESGGGSGGDGVESCIICSCWSC